MFDRPGHIAAQVQGRSLMRKQEFSAAAALFESALSLARSPSKSSARNAGHDDKLVQDEVNSLGSEVSDAPRLRKKPLQWIPSEGSDETVVLSTRLLLSIAVRNSGDLTQGFLQLQQLASQPKDLVPGSALHHAVFMSMAQLCLQLADSDKLAFGLAACKQLLSPALLERDAWEMAQAYDIEAALHIASCHCDVRCACGSLESARVATEAAISACSRAAGLADIGHKRNLALGICNKAQRKQQAIREDSLRHLKIKLGLVDVLAEEAAAEAAENRRQRNRCHRRRRQARAAGCLDDILQRLAPQVEIHRHVLPGLCSTCSGLSESRVDWARIPAVLQPGSVDVGGLAHDPHRVTRKRWQLESLFVALSHVLAHHRPGQGKLHIVDFGSGSGNSVLPIAALLPTFQITLVEASREDVSISRRRVADAGLQNVIVWHGDVADFPTAFDVGLATHLCGEGTDLAQAKCLEHRAAFILTPCCLGMVKHVLQGQSRNQGVPENIRSIPSGGGVQLRYPRSKWLQQHMGTTEYMQLVRLCDCNDTGAGNGAMASATHSLRPVSQTIPPGDPETTPPPPPSPSVASKQLLDADRLKLAAEAGYETHCCKLWPEEASKKNDVLIGWPKDIRH